MSCQGQGGLRVWGVLTTRTWLHKPSWLRRARPKNTWYLYFKTLEQHFGTSHLRFCKRKATNLHVALRLCVDKRIALCKRQGIFLQILGKFFPFFLNLLLQLLPKSYNSQRTLENWWESFFGHQINLRVGIWSLQTLHWFICFASAFEGWCGSPFL